MKKVNMEKTAQRLSSLIVAPQQPQLVLIIDDTGRERVAQRLLRKFLNEQGQDEATLKTLPLNERLKQNATLARFLADCNSQKNQKGKQYNVVLPTLADLLCYQRPVVIFEFLHELRNCEGIQRCFIWATTQHLLFPKVDYLLAACEYLCDTRLHLIDEQNVSCTTRKPGGGVVHKNFIYKIENNEFLIQTSGAGEIAGKNQQSPSAIEQTKQPSAENMSTFKIELDEEELVARNAMKMPYEKTSEADSSGGNIVYTPDASDDFDDEDPDEDLCI